MEYPHITEKHMVFVKDFLNILYMSEKKAPATKRGRDVSPNSSSSDNSEIAEIFKTRGKQKKTKQRKKQYVGRPSAPFNEYVDDSDTSSIGSTDAISPQGALLPPTFTTSPPRHGVIPPRAPSSNVSSLSLSGGLDDAFASMDVAGPKKEGGKTKKSKRKTKKSRRKTKKSKRKTTKSKRKTRKFRKTKR
jgi:hypothetical protein